MILTISDVAKMKKELAELFFIEIHFHDGCGGQYFAVDSLTEETKTSLSEYFAKQNRKVCFSESGTEFFVKELR